MIIHIPAADAVENSYTFRGFCKFAVFVSDENIAPGGTCCIAKPLEFETGKNIGKFAIAKLLHGSRVHEVESGSYDDTAHFDFSLFRRHRVINSVWLTYLHTLIAFRAYTALETAFGLGHCIIFIKPKCDLLEITF